MNTPKHYTVSKNNAPNGLIAILQELADVEETPSPYASICLFNARKYLLRAPRKGKMEDLIKARDYLDALIKCYIPDPAKPSSLRHIYIHWSLDNPCNSFDELVDKLGVDYSDLEEVGTVTTDHFIQHRYIYTGDDKHHA